MGFVLSKLRERHVWQRIFRERLTEPLHLNVLSLFVWAFGSYRAKIAHDLVVRQQNAYGILKAADCARSLGIRKVSLLEFGVAAGAGLMNMAAIARRVTNETGVLFSLYGFDTGKGMPPPTDYRDHPDLYQQGEFGMDVAALRNALPENASLILGEISETVGEFAASLSADEPIGFVSIDIDYYTSAVCALRVFTEGPEKYLPVTVVYFDDIYDERHNASCGELLAIEEFNQSHKLRRIEQFRFLENSRIFRRADWIKHMYFLHVLDHPNRCTRSREAVAKVWHKNPYLEK
jgi:methyltransferase family protein